MICGTVAEGKRRSADWATNSSVPSISIRFGVLPVTIATWASDSRRASSAVARVPLGSTVATEYTGSRSAATAAASGPTTIVSMLATS